MIFYFFLRFHENRRIFSCFHRRYEFCMQKYPSKWNSIEDTISANFIKGYSLAIQPIFSKILKFLILLYCLLFHLKIIFDYFLWQSAQEFQWKSQTINKYEWFSIIFLRFHENRMILSCFHRRYEFCMQKCRSKCIFIEFLYKAQFRLILSKAIALRFNRFSQKFENF